MKRNTVILLYLSLLSFVPAAMALITTPLTPEDLSTQPMGKKTKYYCMRSTGEPIKTPLDNSIDHDAVGCPVQCTTDERSGWDPDHNRPANDSGIKECNYKYVGMKLPGHMPPPDHMPPAGHMSPPGHMPK